MPTVATPQRQISPVPPGRYWVDLVGADAIGDFLAWVRDMEGAVVVESVERERRERDPTAIVSQGTIDFAFVIFGVPEGRAPFWPKHLGFPNFAARGQVHRRADVAEAPPPEPLKLPDFGAFGAGVGVGSGAIALLLLIVLLK